MQSTLTASAFDHRCTIIILYYNKTDPGGLFYKYTSWQICGTARSQKTRDFLLLNIDILILHYASMLPEIDKTELLSSSIARLSAENDIIKAENNKIKAENDKIRAENTELKARIAKLEDKQTQNELIKNLLSVSQKLLT